jgi:hypothetical protein
MSEARLGHPGDVRCTTALPPKAEVDPRGCYVAFVPQAVIAASSLDHLIGALLEGNLAGDCTGRSRGFAPRRMRST